MKDEVAQFLASDLLENYVMGSTTDKETQQVEYFIDSSPEVNAEYLRLQESLEAYARSFAVKAPDKSRDYVLRKLSYRKPTTISWYRITASIAVLIFASSTLYFWNANRILNKQNAVISNTIQSLKTDIEAADNRFSTIEDQFKVINDPSTQKYVLIGNEKARNLKMLAYVNPSEKTSYINIIHLPKISEDQCFQMWADVDGEMLSVAILENKENMLLAVPYKENAVSYNITIEPKGGNNHATVENLVANVLL